MKKTTIQTNINIDITDEDIQDIFCTAVEGGIDYWCASVTVPRQLDSLDYWIRFTQVEVCQIQLEDGDIVLLTVQKLLNGIRMWLQNYYDRFHYDIIESEQGRFKLNCGMIDADVADSMVQLALFNDIIYG